MTNYWEQAEQEFACTHDTTEIRYKLDSLGRRIYQEQCMHCGAGVGNSIKYDQIADKESVLPFEEHLAQRHMFLVRSRYEDLCAESESLHRTRKSDWWQKYNEYLSTDTWQDKRRRVLERDGYMCQACLKRKATTVHHLTYKHLKHEPLFELVAVCKVCHDALHDEDETDGRDAQVSPVLSL